MLLNLTDCFEKQGFVTEESVEPEMRFFKLGNGSYKLTQKEAIRLRAEHVSLGRIRLSGGGTLVFEARCDRCLSPVSVPLELEIDREIVSPEGTLREDEDEEEAREYLDGYSLDTERLLDGEIATAWPFKILCKEDCKGICPVCGANRNDKECGCNTKVPDPRFAGLSELLEGGK